MEEFSKKKEKPEAPILSEKMNIVSKKAMKEGAESIMHESLIKSANGTDQRLALKEVKNKAYATDEEMENNKSFYRSLRNFEKFRKFIPPTAYIRARNDAESDPQTFRLQRFIEGTSVDKLTDEELYKNPTIVRQLEEFAEAAVEVIEKSYKDKTVPPDFGRTPEAASLRVWIGSMLINPRYSSNIFIADKPDKNGRQVFFVDTAAQTNIAHKKISKLAAQYFDSPVQIFYFKKWRKKLQAMLNDAVKEK
jgi:hypothetical protein